MRFFIVKYIKQPNGQFNEQSYMDKKVRKRDEDMASIILDYKDRKVVKAVMNDEVLPRDFDRLDSFYHPHYPETIDYLRSKYSQTA